MSCLKRGGCKPSNCCATGWSKFRAPRVLNTLPGRTIEWPATCADGTEKDNRNNESAMGLLYLWRLQAQLWHSSSRCVDPRQHQPSALALPTPRSYLMKFNLYLPLYLVQNLALGLSCPLSLSNGVRNHFTQKKSFHPASRELVAFYHKTLGSGRLGSDHCAVVQHKRKVMIYHH